MLQGGPSVEYLYMLAEDPRNMLIFVSYQVSGTLGRQIKDGAREIAIVSPEGKLEVVKIRMEVASVEGFSGHSDRKQLLAYIENIKPRPKNIILNHGEPSAIRSLAKKIEKTYRNEFKVYTPKILESLYLSGAT